MANPQLENGFTQIANEIMDALCRIRIPGEARQILDVILRKTYGFHKKSDAISLSQFHLATGMVKPSIIRAIRQLEVMNLINKKANGQIPKYSFIKDYSAWKPLAKKLTISEKANNRLQKSKYSLAKKLHTKESIKRKKKDISIDLQNINFLSFWQAYPARNGKKTGREETCRRFLSLNKEDQQSCIMAAKNFAAHPDTKHGIGIKDPERFLKLGSGEEPWREWVEAASQSTDNTQTKPFGWDVQSKIQAAKRELVNG